MVMPNETDETSKQDPPPDPKDPTPPPPETKSDPAKSDTGQEPAKPASKHEDPKTLEEALALIAKLQDSTHDANREAADRRIKLKKQEEDRANESARLRSLEGELAAIKSKEAFDIAVKKAGHVFANDEASQDALAYAREIVSQEEKTYEAALKQVISKRPYLLKVVDIPDINDAVKSDAKGNIIIDEKAIANDFGIKVLPGDAK